MNEQPVEVSLMATPRPHLAAGRAASRDVGLADGRLAERFQVVRLG